MTRLKSFIAILAGVAVAPLSFAGTLTFTVDGVEARGGDLYIGVQTEDQFMKNDGIAGDVINAPTAGSHTMSFDLPDGDYSVSVWHDDDGDGVFEVSDAGMPIEGWAMANGSSLTGLPTFDQVKVKVGEAGASVTETITYHD
ncbi:MAG: DUF2141 domain-containing protein [Pseudomonadota bacterium]